MNYRKKKILLYGWFGEENIGDELILRSLIKLVKDVSPFAQVYVMGSKPAIIRQLHSNLDGASTYFDHRPKTLLRLMKYGPVESVRNAFSADIIIMATGGALSDWNPASTIAIFDLINLWSKLKKPVFLFGVGAGPIEKSESYKKFYKTLCKAQLITVRDGYSRDQLLKLGLKNVYLTKDIVFELHRDNFNPFKRNPVKKIGIVAAPICRETPVVYEEFVANLGLASRMLSEKYDVSYIPFQASYDNSLFDDIHRIDPNAKVFSVKDDLWSTLEFFKEQDLIIGMRFHSLVEALSNGIRAIPIIYHPKCYSLCDEFDLLPYAQYVGNGNNWKESNISACDLVNAVERIQADATYCDRMERKMSELLHNDSFETELLIHILHDKNLS